jgi:hypothetical protein
MKRNFFNVVNCVIFIIRCGTCTDIDGGSKYVHSLSDIKFILINAASLYTRKSQKRQATEGYAASLSILNVFLRYCTLLIYRYCTLLTYRNQMAFLMTADCLIGIISK